MFLVQGDNEKAEEGNVFNGGRSPSFGEGNVFNGGGSASFGEGRCLSGVFRPGFFGLSNFPGNPDAEYKIKANPNRSARFAGQRPVRL